MAAIDTALPHRLRRLLLKSPDGLCINEIPEAWALEYGCALQLPPEHPSLEMLLAALPQAVSLRPGGRVTAALTAEGLDQLFGFVLNLLERAAGAGGRAYRGNLGGAGQHDAAATVGETAGERPFGQQHHLSYDDAAAAMYYWLAGRCVMMLM